MRTFCHNFRTRCHMLPDFVMTIQLIIGSCGTSATTPFVLTPSGSFQGTASPRTENPGSQGSDSVRFSILRGGIPRSVGNFPDVWTQRFLVCHLPERGIRKGGVRKKNMFKCLEAVKIARRRRRCFARPWCSRRLWTPPRCGSSLICIHV